MKKSFLFGLFLASAMLLASCSPAQNSQASQAGGAPQAWFDMPLPNSVYALGPVQIIAHGSDASGISRFELMANETTLTIPSPDTTNSIVTLTYSWTPPQAGIYQLQLRARNSSGSWSSYAQTIVRITEAGTPSQEPSPTTERNPSAVIERISQSTETVFYAMSGGAVSVACGDASVTVRAKAVDPTGITVVMLFYRLKSQAGGETTDFIPITMTPIGQDLYQAVLTPQNLFNDGLIGSYGTSWLQYQLIIQNRAGDTATRTQVFSDLTLQGCTR